MTVPDFLRIEPRCRYFGECGGCTLQDRAYEDQRALKARQLRSLLADIAGPQADSLAVEGCTEPWRYRNKAEFSFGESDGRLTLGLHAARSFHRIIDIDDCLLLPQTAMPVLRSLLRLAEESRLTAYQTRSHQGFWRHVVIRISRAAGRMLLLLVTAEATGPQACAVAQCAESLFSGHPGIGGIYWGQTDRLSDVAFPQKLDLLCGGPLLDEQIGRFRLKLHPLSFLQSNSAIAARLYEALSDELAGGPDAVAWDVYCGGGLIGFHLSDKFKTVYGIDSEPHSLKLAEQNAALNGISNMRWACGRAEDVFADRRFWLTEARPDAVVVDPPRAGLSRAVASVILGGRPSQIAYVSCNPQALVADLKLLLGGFPRYRLACLKAFDMFPQTPHVETLAVLAR